MRPCTVATVFTMLCRALLIFCVLVVCTASTVDVDTVHGIIRGSSVEVDGRSVWQFLGIPFAEPPAGPLRFLPPQPVATRWTEPLIADKAPKGCLQIPFSSVHWPEELAPRYGEDCLYLNVWTPSVTGNRSVLVWIHGGSFIVGEGLPMHDGRVLSAIGDLVVVVIHYRLNFLGFARLDDDLVPGNMGLLDQLTALGWVQRCIAAFGGDPGSVTLAGESAGAASVALHMLSERSATLFHRAILLGGATNAWALNPDVTAVERFNRRAAADFFHCDRKKLYQVVSCLQNLTEAELLSGLRNYSEAHPNGPLFGPTIDGRFIDAPLQQLLREGRIHAKDAIIGVTEEEGSLFVKAIEPRWLAMNNLTGEDQHYTPDFVRFAVKACFHYFPDYPHLTPPGALELISLRSISHVDPTSNQRNFERLSKSLSEFYFLCGVNQFTDTLRRVHPNVYYFELARKTNMSIIPMRAPWMKTTHGDDIFFVFLLQMVYSFMPERLDEEEVLLARRIIGDLATFARTGAPRDLNWRPFSLERKEMYRYDVVSSLQFGGKSRDECVFWDQALPLITGMRCVAQNGTCELKMDAKSTVRVRNEL